MPTTVLHKTEKIQNEVAWSRREDGRRKTGEKKITNTEMEGRRPVGRPRARWKDVLRGDLTSSGLSLDEAAAEALNRDSWRTIVRAPCDFNAAGS